MDIKKIKQILESYRFDRKYFDNILNEIKELEKKASEVNLEIDKLRFLERRLVVANKISSSVVDKVERIERIIDSLPPPIRNVLFYRFMRGYRVDRIANIMNYSAQRIYQLQSIGIKLFAENYDKPLQSLCPVNIIQFPNLDKNDDDDDDD